MNDIVHWTTDFRCKELDGSILEFMGPSCLGPDQTEKQRKLPHGIGQSVTCRRCIRMREILMPEKYGKVVDL